MPTRITATAEPIMDEKKLFAYLIVDGLSADTFLVRKAEAGDGDALSFLAGLYYNKKHYKKALAWYTLAAHQNHLFSQVRLGHMYHTGLGTAKPEYKVAYDWYFKAHKNGSAPATNNIGVLYAKGLGFAKNNVYAEQWYESAANMGSSNAQYNLGLHYENGTTGQTNKELALYYYEKSASGGFKKAKGAIKRLKEQGYNIFTKQKFFELEKHLNKQLTTIKSYEKTIEDLRSQLKESEEQKQQLQTNIDVMAQHNQFQVDQYNDVLKMHRKYYN